MTKRFCDTEIWQKEWFQDLSLKEKVLVKYIFENCDCAGFWTANFKMASFIIGEKVTIDDLKKINAAKQQFLILENGDVFVVDFIKFQYGSLSKNCKPHKPIIERLKKYEDLLNNAKNLKGYSKGINTLCNTLEEKEKEKEKDKEKDKENNLLSFASFLSSEKEKGIEPLRKNLTQEEREALIAKFYDNQTGEKGADDG